MDELGFDGSASSAEQPECAFECIGLLLGRVAAIPVQRSIARVRDGALSIVSAYVGETAVEAADVEGIHNKGYITLRRHVGKSGYFFSDDSLATGYSDDYRSLARRRTVDKAARTVYATLLEHLNDEVPCMADGTIVRAAASDIETDVVSDIVSRMTQEGNLGVDPTDPKDKGVVCRVDATANVMSTSKLPITVQVKPYGYAKYLDVDLGFIPVEN